VSKLKEKIATEKGDEYAIENQKLIYAGIVAVGCVFKIKNVTIAATL